MVPSPLAKLVNVIAIGCEEFGLGPYVAFGSITVFEVLNYDFRITLENGLNSDIAACPKRATTGLMRRSKWTLLSSALHFAPVAFLSAIIARILVPWYFRLRRTV
jgi:hypothetical protein